MLYWNEIANDLAKISTCLLVYMTKLKMLYVWAFCHTTDISTTLGSEWMSHERVPTFPRGGLPEHFTFFINNQFLAISCSSRR